jgi:hypothetical protein
MSGSALMQALLKLAILMMLIVVALKTRGLRRPAFPAAR